jgi:hypothetical protein
MKKFLILGMAVFLAFGFTSQAAADLVITTPTKVQFYSDDDSLNGNSNITITDINFGALGTLEYNVGSTGWTPYSFLSPVIPVPTSAPAWRNLVELRVKPGVGDYIYGAIKMVFIGENSTLPNHYDSLNVYWTAFTDPSVKIDFIGTNDGVDNVSPVPLPGAVWLLGAGLIGLVGVRRRLQG